MVPGAPNRASSFGLTALRSMIIEGRLNVVTAIIKERIVPKQAEAAKGASGVKVLGSGCAKCNALESAVREALAELGMDTTIDHVTDFTQRGGKYRKTRQYLLNGCRIFQMERADNCILVCVLSTLRLCVWLFDNGYLYTVSRGQGRPRLSLPAHPGSKGVCPLHSGQEEESNLPDTENI